MYVTFIYCAKRKRRGYLVVRKNVRVVRDKVSERLDVDKRFAFAARHTLENGPGIAFSAAIPELYTCCSI